MHHVPEQPDGRMLLIVIADGINASVQGIPPEILHVNVARLTTHQGLQLRLVEHGQPRGLDDLSETLQKCIGLQGGLHLKAIPGNVGYIHQSVLVGDRGLGAIVSQLFCDCAMSRPRHRDRVGDGEVQGKIFDVPGVIF